MGFDFVKALRRNHAIEHATVALLIAKMRSRPRLVGRATASGFYIYGDVSTEAISQAAEEGLTRLKHGEHDLAVSSRCGTNLAVAAVLAGLASMLTIRGKRGSNQLPNAILASLAAIALAQPLGRMAQRYLTTSSDVATVSISEVTSKGEGTRTHHKIKTLQG